LAEAVTALSRSRKGVGKGSVLTIYTFTLVSSISGKKSNGSQIPSPAKMNKVPEILSDGHGRKVERAVGMCDQSDLSTNDTSDSHLVKNTKNYQTNPFQDCRAELRARSNPRFGSNSNRKLCFQGQSKLSLWTSRLQRGVNRGFLALNSVAIPFFELPVPSLNSRMLRIENGS